jgi:hypothetical protein
VTVSSTMHDLLVREYTLIPLDMPVNPRLLAEAVIARLDPPHSADSGAYCWGLAMTLAQMARDICRNRFREAEQASESGELFDFKLQPRYPSANGEDYLPLDLMDFGDFWHNIARLRKEAAAKNFHADALLQECDARVRSGKISQEVTA